MLEILKEDSELAKERLKQITQELRHLAVEFNIVLNQSSETWHDNAPWDDAKAREAILLAEQEELEKVLKTHIVREEPTKSGVGKNYHLEVRGKEVKVYLAGDYSLRTGQTIKGYVVITKESPLAKQILA